MKQNKPTEHSGKGPSGSTLGSWARQVSGPGPCSFSPTPEEVLAEPGMMASWRAAPLE